jgi:hypothetical protein
LGLETAINNNMINFRNIGVQYLTGILFGLFALVLSLLIGFLSGNRISLVIFRTFLNTFIFSLIGTGCIFIIKRFVPEIYQIISFSDDAENIEIKTEEISGKSNSTRKKSKENPESNSEELKQENPDSAENEMSLNEKRDDTELENEFNVLDKQPSGFSSENSSNNNSDNVSSKIIKDNSIKYEPKIAAQAIRTMMKKDE